MHEAVEEVLPSVDYEPEMNVTSVGVKDDGGTKRTSRQRTEQSESPTNTRNLQPPKLHTASPRPPTRLLQMGVALPQFHGSSAHD